MRALIVRGGWAGHEPVACTDLFRDVLEENGFELRVADTLDAYTESGDHELIVQCWTGARFTAEQEKALVARVRAGAGFAGWHGGIVATGYEAPDYQYMVGGRFLCHPGDFVDYRVEIAGEHPITAGLGDYDVHTEQYFMHVDPTLDVLATTTFRGEHGAPETAGAVMPVAWTRRFGAGRVFVHTLGHSPADLRVPQTRTMIERGLLWAGLGATG
ncbi:ThuA domain-containing protein [Actinoplanes ianthinogenes]|uniref:ThuA domain-containing protein n=1 Tax=Actinoplanes ianthinogenes TaxID=122358 RepID=UPI00167139AD|nr:ThuA domain-containing protein [Actinoplanes ianthinogenes]